MRSAHDDYGTSFTTNGIIIGAPPRDFRVHAITGHNTVAKKAWGKLNRLRTQLTMGNLKRPSLLWVGGEAGAWFEFLPLTTFTGSWHSKNGLHNLFYADGHVAQTRVIKGKMTTGDYTVNPFGAGRGDTDGAIAGGVAK